MRFEFSQQCGFTTTPRAIYDEMFTETETFGRIRTEFPDITPHEMRRIDMRRVQPPGNGRPDHPAP